MTENFVVLAQLLRPQGRKGELLAEVLTDFRERFAYAGVVTLLPPANSNAMNKTTNIVAHWFPVGRNAGRVVLQFAGVESISAAEELAGWKLALPQAERMPLEDDAAYISDLIGCELYDGDVPVGTVEEVELPAPAPGEAAADAPALLRVIRGEGGVREEHLVPFAKAWLVTMDTAAKRITMKLPTGLLDINKG